MYSSLPTGDPCKYASRLPEGDTGRIKKYVFSQVNAVTDVRTKCAAFNEHRYE